jgi:hypothetical protein
MLLERQVVIIESRKAAKSQFLKNILRNLK